MATRKQPSDKVKAGRPKGKSYPEDPLPGGSKTDNYLWINGVREIGGLIQDKTYDLRSEKRRLESTLQTIREKTVKGNLYLYVSIDGAWVYKGRKRKGKDYVTKTKKRIIATDKEITKTIETIRSYVLFTKSYHLIVSKRFMGRGYEFISLKALAKCM